MANEPTLRPDDVRARVDVHAARRAQWRHLAGSLARPESETDVSRREFVRRMAASMGLAGLAACTRTTPHEILPYVSQPPEVTPGNPQYYATAFVLGGYATGLLVESHEGRPTKVEGNPGHPDSLGGTSIWEQASVLGLYDPARARDVLKDGVPDGWEHFAERFVGGGGEAGDGTGLHFLLEPTSSPTQIGLIGRVRARLPGARVHFWSPLARDRVWQGAKLALGRPLETQLDLGAARVILAIDGDLFDTRPGRLRYARAFADGRRLPDAKAPMNRLYVAESGISVTGAIADHRLAVHEADLPALAAAIASQVMGGGAQGRAAAPGSNAKWASVVARDLLANRGASAVVVGDAMAPEVHAIGHFMNDALGNVGPVVRYTAPAIFEAGEPTHGLGALLDALDAGEVATLVILGGNPAYTAGADARFGERMRKARDVVVLTGYENETASAARWLIPEAHDLESWGDARSVDGTVTVVQPLVEPLFAGRTVNEVLALFAGQTGMGARALVADYWHGAHKKGAAADFDAVWARALTTGVMEGTAFPEVTAKPDAAAFGAAIARIAVAPRPGGLALRFRADPRVYDGRFANNGWLLELPDPIHQVSWDNAAFVSPATAKRLELETGHVVRLEYRGHALDAPVLVQPGHADDCVTLPLGWGRQGKEELARGVGFDAYALRTLDAPYLALGATLAKTGASHEFAHAQNELNLHGRDKDIYFHAPLAVYRAQPDLTKDQNEPVAELYDLRPDAPRQWGMVVDLTTCIGCNACTVACQAENNVPIVGKAAVAKGRRMHWLRVDRYVIHTGAEAHLGPQPMLCQHCEKAPCEYVCPVNATVHSSDGLNQMVYNRCVGTRFCSNNCPYKVRRFNWFNYNAGADPLTILQRNPDVTSRDRGVMEKCSYCVQRIREVEIRARREDRPVVDGEIQTACQQACPTGAIVFGDIADKGSNVSRQRRIDRLYAALHEVGTQPRTRYLAKIVNPNPELA